MKIAFVGIGQRYPSHLWMGRMKEMLGDRIVVNIDDLRNTDRGAEPLPETRYIPRKQTRVRRALRALKLSHETDRKLRSEWMLDTISRSGASLVFVHFLDFACQFSEVWSRLDIPVVVHCHGYDITWDVRHHVKGTSLHPADYQNQVKSLPSNVWFIANSKYTKQQLRKLDINEDKIFIKRFGVPLADSPRKEGSNESPQVLFLGRLVDFKGPVETVRAFSKIADRHQGSSLQIAGDGDLKSELCEVIRDLGSESSIHCHGAVSPSKGKALRQNSSIFTAHNQVGATTGQQEAFGVSMLEAMGEGIPVVTGKSGGLVDFIQHEQNGLLFNSGDIDAHAERLDELMSSHQLRRSLGEAAWETVRDNYLAVHEQSDLIRIFEHASKVQSSPTVLPIANRAA